MRVDRKGGTERTVFLLYRTWTRYGLAGLACIFVPILLNPQLLVAILRYALRPVRRDALLWISFGCFMGLGMAGATLGPAWPHMRASFGGASRRTA